MIRESIEADFHINHYAVSHVQQIQRFAVFPCDLQARMNTFATRYADCMLHAEVFIPIDQYMSTVER
jgi:hypothetical protein